ncbi:MAG: hypothetical protein C0626_03845 [Arcobacter sp.]|uniref:hypothetical protein n=1 Tax=uncultured Arcobacter sp. TaxID=165434 RepID=UPI000CBEB79E|nr:hypothetical protein [uncultured Arcobacter sp.]PLY10774.1 MAG: hypothetical protein C0626_03845 [Arcobacter sp.]
MEDLKYKIICECGEKTVLDAVKIFETTDLPYKKAKKLVTGCNKTCCRKPLMALFNMVDFGFVDYEEVSFLIDAMNDRLKGQNEK